MDHDANDNRAQAAQTRAAVRTLTGATDAELTDLGGFTGETVHCVQVLDSDGEIETTENHDTWDETLAAIDRLGRSRGQAGYTIRITFENAE